MTTTSLINKPVRQTLFHLLVTAASMTAMAILAMAVDISEQSITGYWMQHSSNIALLIFISCLFMILCAMTPLPAEAVTVANGMLLGPFLGTAVTWLSAMLGAYITFALSRRLFEKKYNDAVDQGKYRRVDHWLRKYGIWGFMLARLIPVVPFFSLNIAAAFLPIGNRNYLLITGIAILPHIILICAMSGHLVHA